MLAHSLSLLPLWSTDDRFIQLIALILILFSVVSWTIIALKIISNLQNRRVRRFLSASQFTKLPEDIEKNLFDHPQSIFAPIVQEVQFADAQISTPIAARHEYLETRLLLGMQRCQEKAQSGLGVLATITASAPFIGLLGTVWGIYRTLQSFAESQSVGIDHLAAPIGEALLMTALGLVVALPSLIFYNIFSQYNKRTLHSIKAWMAAILHQHTLTRTS